MAGQNRRKPQDRHVPLAAYAAGILSVCMLFAGMAAPLLSQSGAAGALVGAEAAALLDRMARPLIVAGCLLFPLCELLIFGPGRRAAERSGSAAGSGQQARRPPHPSVKLAAQLVDMAMEAVPLGKWDSAARGAVVARLQRGEQELLECMRGGKSIEGLVRYLLSETLHDQLHARIWNEGRLRDEDMPLLKASLIHLAKAKEYGFIDEEACRRSARRLCVLAHAGGRRTA